MTDKTITIIIIIAVLTIFLGVFAITLDNENKRITEGIIVDKQYKGGNYQNFPETYRFCIEGKKNGETVRYWFSVPEAEYVQYKIGDYYKK